MRPPVPVAGRRAALRGLGTGLALLAGCGVELREIAPEATNPLRAPPAEFLRPLATVSGGFTLAPAPVMGVWLPPPGPFLALIRPVAAAARGNDLYLADAGHNAMYHYDLERQTLRRFLALGGQLGLRLCVLEDRSVLVLDPMRRRLTRVSRDGVALARLQDTGALAGATDMAYDERSGMVWLNDAIGGRLLALRPAFNALLPSPLPMLGDAAVAQVSALAAGPDALYVLDVARRRVLRLDGSGRVQQTFGELELQLPRALAVDRERRVYVAEAQGVKVYFDGRLLASFAASELGALEIRDLRVHDGDLAIADAMGGRVHLFRIQAGGA
jgi:hypothetical protein